MEFRILGPLEVVADGGPLELGRRKQRAVLAILLVHVNRVVGLDRLVEELWGEELGIDPTPWLRRLEGRILQQSSELDWTPTTARWPARRRWTGWCSAASVRPRSRG